MASHNFGGIPHPFYNINKSRVADIGILLLVKYDNSVGSFNFFLLIRLIMPHNLKLWFTVYKSFKIYINSYLNMSEYTPYNSYWSTLIIIMSWIIHSSITLLCQAAVMTWWGLSDETLLRDSISWFDSCDKYSYIRSVYSQCHVDSLKYTDQNVHNQTLTQVSQLYVYISFCLKVIGSWLNLPTCGNGHVICMGVVVSPQIKSLLMQRDYSFNADWWDLF